METAHHFGNRPTGETNHKEYRKFHEGHFRDEEVEFVSENAN